MLAVGIGEVGAEPAETILDLDLRLVQLAAKLVVVQLRQAWMRHGMRTDQYPTIRMTSQLVPIHGGELCGIVAGKLGNRQGRTVARVTGADEDLDRNSEPLELGKDGCRTAKCVVEGCDDLPEPRQRPHLAQQQVGLDAEPVLPCRRNGV